MCSQTFFVKVSLVAWKWSVNVCGTIPYRVASYKIKEANGSLFHLKNLRFCHLDFTPWICLLVEKFSRPTSFPHLSSCTSLTSNWLFCLKPWFSHNVLMIFYLYPWSMILVRNLPLFRGLYKDHSPKTLISPGSIAPNQHITKQLQLIFSLSEACHHQPPCQRLMAMSG